LQQILGLPSASEPRLVCEIATNPQDVFRPCISDQKPDAASCALAPPRDADPAPAAPAADAAAERLRADYDALSRSYSRLHRSYQDLAAVAGHLLTSHQLGFRQDYEAKPGDYPDKGFPFTGLGWTYDWRPGVAATHFGVSEFVVRQGARAPKSRSSPGPTRRSFAPPRNEAGAGRASIRARNPEHALADTGSPALTWMRHMYGCRKSSRG
jgi:hypothetical protein